MSPSERPTEWAAAAAGIAVLLAYALGFGDQRDIVIALTAVLTVVPAAVTALVVAYRKAKAPGG